ncbi:MAG TPA: class F sortase [Roseiflexaceae bacterium]|nr:class F sortase [Roseiflexaceae bacterium]
MPKHRWTIIIAALLLSACGAAPPSEQPAVAPTQLAAPTQPAATAAPTAAPAPTDVQPTAAPTAELFRAEPTAPVVVPPTAEPTEAPQATARPAAAEDSKLGQPARIVIDAVDIDQKIVSVGLDKNRIPIVPSHDVGWYNLSAQPGQGDNVVFWGHVLRFRQTPKIPAPFARLKEVKPGAEIVIYDQAGKTHTYVVKQQVWALPSEVEYILPKDREMITLVSCIGDKVINNGEVVDESHRLITIAEPSA